MIVYLYYSNADEPMLYPAELRTRSRCEGGPLLPLRPVDSSHVAHEHVDQIPYLLAKALGFEPMIARLSVGCLSR